MTDDKRAYGNNMGKLSDEKLLKIAKEINRLNPKPKIEDQNDFLDIIDNFIYFLAYSQVELY